MQRGGYPQQAVLSEPSGSSTTLAFSLLLLVASYALLVAAPAVSAYFSGLSSGLSYPVVQRWVPVAAGGGLAIGGAAGLVYVLERLLRGLREHPYASVAPTLALFSGALLVSLSASLPLSGVAPGVLGVFALALSVLGGALIERKGVPMLLGWAVTLFPGLCLVATIWSLSPASGLGAALWSLEASGRLFLLVLMASSAALALLATFLRFTQSSLVQAAPLAQVAPSTPPLGLARASARDDTLELWLQQQEGRMARKGLPWWAYAAALPVVVALGLALRGQLSEPAPAQGLRASPIEEPAHVRKFIEARTAAVSAQGEPAASEPSMQPSVESLAVAAPAPMPTLPMQEPQPSPAEVVAEPLAVLPVVELVAEPPAVASLGLDVQAQAITPSVAPAAPASANKPRPLARTKAPKGKLGRATAKAAPPQPAAARAPLAVSEKAEPAPKPLAPSRGDESLDELMDRVVEPKAKRGKVAAPSVGSAEDPIFGL